MRQLFEIRHAEGLDEAGGVVERLAVRGIVARDRQLLLLYSPRNLDYKFPGGGVEPGEDPAAALRREVLEECGARVTSIGEPFGEAVEYMRAIDPGFEVFRMTSRYISCTVADGFAAQDLEAYERDLGLRPVWVDVDEALATNERVLRSDQEKARWLGRETTVLRLIERELLR